MTPDTSPNLSTLAFVVAIIGAFLWVQHDDARVQKVEEGRAKAIAEQRRAAAAERACGPRAEPVWIDAQTHHCLRRVDAAEVARRTL